jgi:hypothetical protein
VPLVKPKHRPGADVAPIDRDPVGSPNRPPDQAGVLGTRTRVTYKSWQVGPARVKGWLYQDGKRINSPPLGQHGRRLYHTAGSLRELRAKAHRRANRFNVPSSRGCPTRKDYEAARARKRKKRERKRQRYDVETDRADGKTRNRLVRR